MPRPMGQMFLLSCLLRASKQFHNDTWQISVFVHTASDMYERSLAFRLGIVVLCDYARAYIFAHNWWPSAQFGKSRIIEQAPHNLSHLWMTFCYRPTSGILLIVTNIPYILKTNTVFRKIHQIFQVAGLFFLLTNCWQPAAAGTDVHFFSYN